MRQVVLLLLVCSSALVMARTVVKPENTPSHTTVKFEAIDHIDVDWWDDQHQLLEVDIVFNFSLITTGVTTDKPGKTHIIRMITTGTSAQSYRNSYSGKEHHAVPKQFRDIIEEIRYEGSKYGKANLVLYLYKSAKLSYSWDNDLRTLHLELTDIQGNHGSTAPTPSN